MTDRNPGRPGLFSAFGPVFLVLAFAGLCFFGLAVAWWVVWSLIEGSPTIS